MTTPTLDDLVRQQLGALLFANIGLQAQLAAARAEIVQLRAAEPGAPATTTPSTP